MQLVGLPADERIVVRISLGSDESATPIYTRTKGSVVRLHINATGVVSITRSANERTAYTDYCDGREKIQPVQGVGKLFNFCAGYTQTL